MGRPTNAELAEREAEEKPAPARLPKVTYCPEGDGAPHETIWNRHRFRANIPISVRDVPQGLTAAQMIEVAKNNPHFSVEGFPKAKSVGAIPDSPERYRSYAVGWIRIANSSDEMNKRWKDEAELREECGVGSDDVEYLQTIFQPRQAILKESEKLSAAAVND
jgi:hypothetical protein